MRRATCRQQQVDQKRQTSIHALHAEGDGSPKTSETSISDFNPRPPCGGRPPCTCSISRVAATSIHALHAEGDAGRAHASPCATRLQSTPSMRRATFLDKIKSAISQTSIHALHAEGDAHSLRLCVAGQ